MIDDVTFEEHRLGPGEMEPFEFPGRAGRSARGRSRGSRG